MGINVIRRAAGQAHEGGELTVELALDPIKVRGVEEPLRAHIERHVNAEPEVRPLPRLLDGRLGVRAIDEEAGAGDDAAVVGLEDPAIDLRRLPEIVRVDDCEALSGIGSKGRRCEQGTGCREPCRDTAQARPQEPRPR